MSLTLITGPVLEPLTVQEARRQCLLGDTTAGESAPTKPAAALASPAAPGNCDAGSWRVAVTFVTPEGETDLGPLADVVTVANPAVNGQIAVTQVALGGARVTARNVYAIGPAGGQARLVGSIANNTATTYTLNLSAATLATGRAAPTANTTVDPELSRLIADARERAEGATWRQFITATWDLLLDDFPHEAYLELPKPPLQSVTHVKYRDRAGALQTWASSNYVVEAPAGPRCARGRIGLAYGVTWPSTYGQIGDVQVRFVAGYGATGATVPARLRSAMLLDVATHYAQRENAITGTSVAELPMGSAHVYRAHKSYPTQRLRMQSVCAGVWAA